MTDALKVFSIFQNPIKYVRGVRRGFIVTPEDQLGTTWGEPFTAEDGSTITPGTEGGPNNKAFAGVKDSDWKVSRSLKRQEVGNIDWKGPWEIEGDKRTVLTVNGPAQRYWNSGSFTYGSDDTHYEIYGDGRIVGIAPYPALAASYFEHKEQDGSTTKYLAVICVDGNRDVAFVRSDFANLLSTEIDDTLRTDLKARYSGVTGTGWLEIGQGFGSTDPGLPTVTPEAPWFFSEDGRTAKTMRRVEISHGNHHLDGASFDDLTYCELEMNISHVSLAASFAALDEPTALNTYLKWSYYEIIFREQKVYTQPSNESDDGFAHDFEEDTIQLTRDMTGQTKVAVDYDCEKGEWVYGWMYGRVGRYIAQYFTIGIDDDQSHPSPNTGSTDGPQPKPNPYNAAEDDHYETRWIAVVENLNLSINNSGIDFEPMYADIALGWGNTGSQTVYAGGEIDQLNDNDNGLKFWDSYNTYVQYVDLRETLVVGQVEYSQIYGTGLGYIPANLDTLWTGVAESAISYQAAKPEDNVFEDNGLNHYFYQHVTEPVPTFATLFGWTRADLATWTLAEDQTLESYNYSATWPNGNEDETYWAPTQDDAFPTEVDNLRPEKVLRKLTLREMFYTPDKCDLEGTFGSTELHEHLIWPVYFDPVEKAVTSSVYTPQISSDLVDVLQGGDRSKKGGVV